MDWKRYESGKVQHLWRPPGKWGWLTSVCGQVPYAAQFQVALDPDAPKCKTCLKMAEHEE